MYSYSGDEEHADALLDDLESLFDAVCSNPYAHAVCQFPEGYRSVHEYRCASRGRCKVFYRTDEGRKTVLIYRVRHVASDFTRVAL